MRSLRPIHRASCRPLISRNGMISSRRRKSTTSSASAADSDGIPTTPTWSVNELLSSYPSPKLSSKTINKLHVLSALVPPEEGTPQYENVKKSLEEMVRLVEAVRLVDTAGVVVEGRREKEDADMAHFDLEPEESGQNLLKHSSRTQNGFYIVNSERRR